MSYFYLATPYSKYPSGIHAAYAEACEQAAVLVKAGIRVFSPIAHSHGIALHGFIDPLDHDIWLPEDRPFMEAAKGLIMCRLPSWEESFGMEQERQYFRNAAKPVFYMDPWVVPPGIIQHRDTRQSELAW